MTVGILALLFLKTLKQKKLSNSLLVFNQGQTDFLWFMINKTCRQCKRLFRLVKAAADLTSFLTWKNSLNFRNQCLAHAHSFPPAILGDLVKIHTSFLKANMSTCDRLKTCLQLDSMCVTGAREKSEVATALFNEGGAV